MHPPVTAPRATHHRLRDQPRWARVLVAGVFLAVVGTPVAGSFLLLHEGWQPLGDRAIVALRADDVWRGQAPLLGQPTTGELATGVRSSHPGPSEFWLLAPFTATLGLRAGAAVGTGVLSALALAATLWLAFRGGGRTLFALVALGCALFVRSLGVAHFADPVNSEVGAVFLLAVVLAAWLVVVGDLVALPVLVAATTVAAQAHVSGAANAAPVVVLVAVALAWRLRRRVAWRPALPWLGAGAAVAILGWLPVLVHELGSSPSNVGALWRTARAGQATVGLGPALDRLVAAVGPVPLFLHGPGAGHVRAHHGPVAIATTWLVLAGVVALGVVHHRRGHRRAAALALVVVVVVAAGWTSAASIPLVDAGREDGVRPLWVVGTVVWATLAWLGWTAIDRRRRVRVEPVGQRIVGAVAALVVLAALATSAAPRADTDGDLMGLASQVQDQVVDRLPDGAYRLQVDGLAAYVTFLPGLVARMEDAGYDVYVDLGGYSRAYGRHREFHGQEVDGTLVLRSEEGEELRGYVDPVRTPRPTAQPLAASSTPEAQLLVYLRR